MTDEFPGKDPSDPEPPPGSPREQPPVPGQPEDQHDPEKVLAGAGDFTSGEGLIAYAGIVLLIVWVVFDVFLDVYPISPLHVLLATTVVLVPRLDPDLVTKVSSSVAAVMKVTGYALALLGVITIIGDIEATSLDEIGAIVGALISYGAYAMAFMGARQVDI